MLVAGVDEVGRGALAGPLVACAAILPPDFDLPGLADSKRLTAPARERLAAAIRRQAVALSVVRVTPARIDREGLHRCNLWALRHAALRLRPRPDFVISDGFRVTYLRVPRRAIPKADGGIASVAAASIVAKVTRDRAMARLGRRYPAYGFRRNKGYGTAEHWEALRALGPSPVHRRSFTGVADGDGGRGFAASRDAVPADAVPAGPGGALARPPAEALAPEPQAAEAAP